MDDKPAANQKAAATLNKEEIREAIKNLVSKEKTLKSKEEKIDMAKVLVSLFEKGGSAKEALGITDEEIAAIYFYGFKIFNAGQYKEAREVFKILYQIKPTSDYATALGACYHKLKEYEAAASLYMAATFKDPMDPVPLFYAYDCYMNMNNPYAAFTVISKAMHAARQDKKYQKLEEKATLLLQGLKEFIEKDDKAAP